jgi:hypothetical protein
MGFPGKQKGEPDAGIDFAWIYAARGKAYFAVSGTTVKQCNDFP